MEEMDETEAVPQVEFRHSLLSSIAFLAFGLLAKKTKEDRIKQSFESVLGFSGGSSFKMRTNKLNIWTEENSSIRLNLEKEALVFLVLINEMYTIQQLELFCLVAEKILEKRRKYSSLYNASCCSRFRNTVN